MAVEVALVARKLLSLGCVYTARYSLPRDAVEEELTFQDFGLDIAAIANSHVFQVAETTGEPSRFPPEFTGNSLRKTPFVHSSGRLFSRHGSRGFPRVSSQLGTGGAGRGSNRSRGSYQA